MREYRDVSRSVCNLHDEIDGKNLKTGTKSPGSNGNFKNVSHLASEVFKKGRQKVQTLGEELSSEMATTLARSVLEHFKTRQSQRSRQAEKKDRKHGVMKGITLTICNHYILNRKGYFE